jgi:hypothetical protein
VEGPDHGGQPRQVVAGILGVEGSGDFLGQLPDGVFDDRRPEGFLGSVPVVDERASHAETFVELPHRRRLVTELGERFPAVLEDLVEVGQGCVGGWPARPALAVWNRQSCSLPDSLSSCRTRDNFNPTLAGLTGLVAGPEGNRRWPRLVPRIFVRDLA